ncbi:hypothetical protein [Nonomuraea aridisoli]|uniref:hypothetical protein n=1 Tax=Nonomuraea aridisoli TaxID=2070368 RepID=UPI0011B937A8|nr:hypothetical protein [Nonomuraea aridisoli]
MLQRQRDAVGALEAHRAAQPVVHPVDHLAQQGQVALGDRRPSPHTDGVSTAATEPSTTTGMTATE